MREQDAWMYDVQFWFGGGIAMEQEKRREVKIEKKKKKKRELEAIFWDLGWNSNLAPWQWRLYRGAFAFGN